MRSNSRVYPGLLTSRVFCGRCGRMVVYNPYPLLDGKHIDLDAAVFETTHKSHRLHRLILDLLVSEHWMSSLNQEGTKRYKILGICTSHLGSGTVSRDSLPHKGISRQGSLTRLCAPPGGLPGTRVVKR